MATLLRCLHKPHLFGGGAGEEGLFLAHCPSRDSNHTQRDGESLGTTGAENLVLPFLLKLKTGTCSH